MYDPELKKTKTYFKVLQILRIFTDLIEAADVNFESFSDKCIKEGPDRSLLWGLREPPFHEEFLVLNQNWALVKSHHREVSKKTSFPNFRN